MDSDGDGVGGVGGEVAEGEGAFEIGVGTGGGLRGGDSAAAAACRLNHGSGRAVADVPIVLGKIRFKAN